MPFKIYFSQHNPLKRDPELKIKTPLERLQRHLPVTRINKCSRAFSVQEVGSDGWSQFFTLYWKRVPCNSCTSLIWVLYSISIFLDWRLGSEPNPSVEWLKFESPSKWNSYEGFNLEHCWAPFFLPKSLPRECSFLYILSLVTRHWSSRVCL